ncbi:MAG: hypothetical protein ABT01_06255 [Clostridium sp. SCN 57-10]|nr:MAG: hypothetical protein ABT01_06255 [Clostridium sp. SCN 57-10]
MNLIVRKATAADAPCAAFVLCESWKSAYSSILTVEELARHTDVEWRTVQLESMIPQVEGGFVVALDGDTTCGLCFYDESRDEDCAGFGEIVALYALSGYWGAGVGDALMRAALGGLAAQGYRRAMLWVFEENRRARRFYEKHGFVCDRDAAGELVAKRSTFGNAREVRYVCDLPCIGKV